MATPMGSRAGTGAGAGTGTDAVNRGRTPAQWYCLLAGAALLAAGLLGFIADSNFDVSKPLDGNKLILFEVNGWHNIVHLLSGAVLLAAHRRASTAKTVAIAFGAVYGLVTLIGLIDGEDVLGLIPINPADNLLHIALSAAGIISGLMSRGRDADLADRGAATAR